MKQWTGLFLLLSTIAAHGSLNRPITITNNITKEMTGYEFWKAKYYPDRLAISINGKILDTGCSIDIPETEKMVTIRYDYSFACGVRTGAKEITFELSPEKRSYDLNFSWHDTWRIIAEGAKAKEAKRMRYKA